MQPDNRNLASSQLLLEHLNEHKNAGFDSATSFISSMQATNEGITVLIEGKRD